MWPVVRFGLRGLGSVAGHEAAVPADHGGRLDDQHHPFEPATVEGRDSTARIVRSVGVNLGCSICRWRTRI